MNVCVNDNNENSDNNLINDENTHVIKSGNNLLMFMSFAKFYDNPHQINIKG